jgi:hypothetical protein
VNGNDGEGIATAQGAAGNSIVNNEMRFNSQFDAYSDDSGATAGTTTTAAGRRRRRSRRPESATQASS